jgi:hypothetical protein
VKTDINVLRSLVVDRVVSEIDGAFIVTSEGGWHVHREPEFFEERSNPQCFLSRVGESHVLCFRRGESDNSLNFRLLNDRRVFQIENGTNE